MLGSSIFYLLRGDYNASCLPLKRYPSLLDTPAFTSNYVKRTYLSLQLPELGSDLPAKQPMRDTAGATLRDTRQCQHHGHGLAASY